jgi:hypothetical protein
MRLHRNVGVQVVQSAIGFFASVPAALVHALNFLISSAGSLVLLRAWNWHERVHRRQWVTALQLIEKSAKSAFETVQKDASLCNQTKCCGECVVKRAAPAHFKAPARAGGEWVFFGKKTMQPTVGGRCTGETIAGAGGPDDEGWP